MPLPDLAYRAIGWFSTTRFTRTLHPWLYRRLAGRGILGRQFGTDALVLTTTGRRSGCPRAVALFGFQLANQSGGGAGHAAGRPAGSIVTDPGTWAVIGSRGGSGRIPDWVLNVRAVPRATLERGGARWPVLAREAAGADYEAIFEQAARSYPGFRVYRKRAAHVIPIVILEPMREAGALATPERGTALEGPPTQPEGD